MYNNNMFMMFSMASQSGQKMGVLVILLHVIRFVILLIHLSILDKEIWFSDTCI